MSYDMPQGPAMGPGMGPGMPPGNFGGMNPEMGMGMNMNQGMDMGLGLERVFPCVRLRGLPFDVTEDEIRIFLGCEPVDILLAKRDGRFSGEAFVVLGSPLQIQMAVDKNKSYMGRRYVEVFRAKKLDYYKAVMAEVLDGTGMPSMGRGQRGDRGGGGGGQYGQQYGGGGGGQYGQQGGYSNGGRSNGYDEGGASTVLRLRGLPYSAQKEDIVRWFEDLQVTPISSDNVHIITDYGRPTGVALVEFANTQDAQVGLSKDKQMMGARYIEVFPSSRDELQRYLPRSY